MNKKHLIIIFSILTLIILSLIIWLIVQNHPTNQVPIVNIQTGINSEAATLPSGQSDSRVIVPQVPNVASKDDTEEAHATEDEFVWVRILFINENDASRRLQAYFDRTGLDQEIILDKCNLINNTNCLADFRSILKICNLTGDDWSHLPLSFNRTTKRCYQGYVEIVDYLQAEYTEVLKNRSQKRPN